MTKTVVSVFRFESVSDSFVTSLGSSTDGVPDPFPDVMTLDGFWIVGKMFLLTSSSPANFITCDGIQLKQSASDG